MPNNLHRYCSSTHKRYQIMLNYISFNIWTGIKRINNKAPTRIGYHIGAYKVPIYTKELVQIELYMLLVTHKLVNFVNKRYRNYTN